MWGFTFFLKVLILTLLLWEGNKLILFCHTFLGHFFVCCVCCFVLVRFRKVLFGTSLKVSKKQKSFSNFSQLLKSLWLKIILPKVYLRLSWIYKLLYFESIELKRINILIIHEICKNNVLSLYCENAIENINKQNKTQLCILWNEIKQPLAFKPSWIICFIWITNIIIFFNNFFIFLAHFRYVTRYDCWQVSY